MNSNQQSVRLTDEQRQAIFDELRELENDPRAGWTATDRFNALRLAIYLDDDLRRAEAAVNAEPKVV